MKPRTFRLLAAPLPPRFRLALFYRLPCRAQDDFWRRIREDAETRR